MTNSYYLGKNTGSYQEFMEINFLRFKIALKFSLTVYNNFVQNLFIKLTYRMQLLWKEIISKIQLFLQGHYSKKLCNQMARAPTFYL